MEYKCRPGTWFPEKTYHVVDSECFRAMYSSNHTNVLLRLKHKNGDRELTEFISKSEMIEVCEKLLEVLKG